MAALWLAIAWPASAAGERIPGKFVWAELVTYNVALSEKFYGALFDWEFEDYEGYRVAWRGEEAIGGLVQRPRKDPEAKSRWIAYMSVEDMAAAKTVLDDAGARVLAEPRQVAGVGTLAVYEDPEGALGEPETLNAIATAGFSEENPEVAEMMGNFKLDDDQYGSLEDMVVNEYGQGQEAEAVQAWLDENPDFVDSLKG